MTAMNCSAMPQAALPTPTSTPPNGGPTTDLAQLLPALQQLTTQLQSLVTTLTQQAQATAAQPGSVAGAAGGAAELANGAPSADATGGGAATGAIDTAANANVAPSDSGATNTDGSTAAGGGGGGDDSAGTGSGGCSCGGMQVAQGAAEIAASGAKGAKGGGSSVPSAGVAQALTRASDVAAKASTDPLPSAKPKSQAEVDAYIKHAATQYGANAAVLREIARRESNFRVDAWNKTDSNAQKGIPSKGMFQFIEPTFNRMAPQARKANPKAWESLGPNSWLDWRQQALTTSWAMTHGHGNEWATFKAAGG